VFFDKDSKGDQLPPRTLCLTYDDGPGLHTRELGHFLFEEGIGATFFVIGRHAEAQPDTLACLQRWGHLIGNHTYSHPGLVALALAGGGVVGELERTDAIIRPYVSGKVTFFRAPYGNWREKKAPDSAEDSEVSVVAGILNRSGRFEHYVGPVNWDISAADYDYWKRGAAAEERARAYLDKIERVGQGIVLIHDSSEDETVKGHNRAMQTTKLLVPILKAKGYRFLRLGSLPQAPSAAGG
jgi:peptidoglycan/xylan/chitin deacetylase (PgdA/CDA1 family)